MKKILWVVLVSSLWGCTESDKTTQGKQEAQTEKISHEFLDATMSKQKVESICVIASEFAENVMDARQNEIPLQDLMAYFKAFSNSEATETAHETEKLNKRYLVEAYKLPKETTEEGMQKAIQHFKEQKYDECINSAQ